VSANHWSNILCNAPVARHFHIASNVSARYKCCVLVCVTYDDWIMLFMCIDIFAIYLALAAALLFHYQAAQMCAVYPIDKSIYVHYFGFLDYKFQSWHLCYDIQYYPIILHYFALAFCTSFNDLPHAIFWDSYLWHPTISNLSLLAV